MATHKKFSRRRSIRQPLGWILLTVPMLIWGIVGIAQLFVITDDQASTHNFAYLSLGIGSFLIGGMSAIAFAQLHLLNDENADDHDEDEVSVDDNRDLVPDELLSTWELLSNDYADEDFATWILSQVGAHRSSDEICQFAARKHLDWVGANSRYDSALHEAAHTVVGLVLEQVPEWTAVREAKDDTGFVGATMFFDRYPRIDPVQDCWDDLRVSAAGIAIQYLWADPYSGVDVDIERMESRAMELVARGRRPDGYTADLTLEHLLRASAKEAETILIDHEVTVEAIAQELMSHDQVGGYRLREIYDQYQPLAS